LRADHGAYPVRELVDELTIALPTRSLQFGGPFEVRFPHFHSPGAVQNLIGPAGVDGRELVDRSTYARIYALATRLARQAATPYDFALGVERFLSPANGFVYDERPPFSQFPLVKFLLSSKHGYCQQFAGAMALLLRMGGVPARVATGFTTGDYDAATRSYVVSDLDAHAWVEAWFPRYGWVRFDPTPGSAPARAGQLGILPALRGGAARRATRATRRNILDRGASAAAAGNQGSGGGVPLPALLAGLAFLVAAGVLAVRAALRPVPSSEQLVAELERALSRSGRPLHTGVTLHGLEQRFRSSPEAAAYVRALRMARFAGDVRLPRPAQRRALRAQLAFGLGPVGRLRAWWALPPRVLH
jgi:transglutaminase-like putative cysteine protease